MPLALAPQMIIDSPYELLARLDDRSLGEEWRARDTKFKNRIVVLKFLRHTGGGDLPKALQEHFNALRCSSRTPPSARV